MSKAVPLAVAVALAAGAAASAQTLSTAFTGTTTSSVANSGTFFNITAANPAGITIDRWEVNSNAAAGTAITVDIYVRAGGYQGFERTASEWALLGSFPATAAGPGVPTSIGIGGLYIGANQTYGVRTVHVNGGHRYSSAGLNASNADAAIDSGATQTTLFSGTPIANRGWNGTIEYTIGNTLPISGACCVADGSCIITTGALCTGQGGIYRGDNAPCSTANCPQPGACCFPATFTCQILSEAQCAAASGNYLGNGTACGACPPPPAGSVALLAATGAADINDVRAKLVGTGLFTEVVITNVTTATPTLEFLQQFDAVLVWTNQSFQSGVAMGDVLADYVDAGGGVVLAVFTHTTTTNNRFLAGRWDTTYQIIPHMLGTTSGAGAGGAQSLGNILIPGHQILEQVNTFNGGTSSFRPTTTDLTAHGVKVAEWTDGKTLIAVSSTIPNRVDLGMYPPSSDSNSTGWVSTTDGARLMANALIYAGGGATPPTCYANCDGSTTEPILNVSDFICFQTKYAAQDPYANCDESTTEPILNVSDFICFQNKYAAGCS